MIPKRFGHYGELPSEATQPTRFGQQFGGGGHPKCVKLVRHSLGPQPNPPMGKQLAARRHAPPKRLLKGSPFTGQNIGLKRSEDW